MAVNNIDVVFKNSFEGVLKSPNVDVPIGINEGEAAPYDLLFGSLASCVYATFLDVVLKKRLPFEGCTMRVSGEKRETVPMTLKKVNVIFEVKGATKESAFLKSAEIATKYCSIYQTIAQVAEMSYEVVFKDVE